jgi:hypothetical protein
MARATAYQEKIHFSICFFFLSLGILNRIHSNQRCNFHVLLYVPHIYYIFSSEDSHLHLICRNYQTSDYIYPFSQLICLRVAVYIHILFVTSVINIMINSKVSALKRVD